MAPAYRSLIRLWPLPAFLAIGLLFWSSNQFGFIETSLLMLCIACAYCCVRPHFGKRNPESMVVVVATSIFAIAYVAQSILYLKSARSTATSLGEAISIRSIFSLSALGAAPAEIERSLLVVLVGFLGILAASLYLAHGNRHRSAMTVPSVPPASMLIISNPITLGYAAIVCTVLFGFLRKLFGLESPTATGLPMGLGGLINIANAYIGPNLACAAFFFALHQGNAEKARKLALISVGLGLYNYVLFTSKLSLIFPVLFLLISQYLLRRQVASMRTLLIMGSVFVTAYPFLNLYRSAMALGIAPGDLIAAIAKMYATERAASDFDHSALEVAISAILGRFVGYDPLMILLQAKPYPGSLVEYLLYGNLDKFLTYDILDFQDPMGYSPGFLGRFYYVSRSFAYLFTMTAGTVMILALAIKRFWRGSVRLQFMAPLLLSYCLIFFTDGLRFELIRSLFLSTVAIYLFLHAAAKLRRVHGDIQPPLASLPATGRNDVP
jgi:hypothetical protein